MIARETSRSIDDAAAAWAAREDRGDLSKADQTALELWLHADPRHAGAYLRARAVAMRSETARALGPGFDPAQFSGAAAAAPSPSRRGMLAWGGGLFAVVATLSVVTLMAPTAHATDRGQIRLVPLPDGSTVMLNTATKITVSYGGDRRLVRLVEGEADFTVVDDATRPFVVTVGDRQIETSGGGGFRIRKLARAPIDILVHQGALKLDEVRLRRPLVLDSNTHIVLSQAGGNTVVPAPEAVSPGLITRELAWREGKIAFEGETLAEAAAAFSRYSAIRILIVAAKLAREPVTGLYAANDPIGFGRAAAALFGAPVKVGRNEIVLGAKQPPA